MDLKQEAKHKRLNHDDLKVSQATGHIQSLKTDEAIRAMDEIQVPERIIIDDPEEFRAAIGQAQMEEVEFIEVSDRLFKFLVKNNKTPYITYGSPGIKVYKAGTKDELDRIDRMNAQEYHEHVSRKV